MNLKQVAKWQLTYRDKGLPGKPLWALHTPRLAIFTSSHSIKIHNQLVAQGWDVLWSVTKVQSIVRRAAWLVAWQNKRIAWKIINSMCAHSFEDMFSNVGLPALYEAALDWDEKRALFSTYSWRCVWSKVKDVLDKLPPLELDVTKLNGELLNNESMIFEAADSVQCMLRNLDKYTRSIVYLRYGCGLEWVQIAKRTKLDVSMVRRWGVQGLEQLRKLAIEKQE